MKGPRSLVFLLSILLISNRLWAQCVTSYPNTEDFESSDGNWSINGVNADWAWGTPGKVRINAAGSGNKCWITGGLTNSTYNGGEKSWIESPCYDFSSLQRPFVNFLVYWDTERQYDGGNFQYSLDNGATWNNVGTSATNVHCRIKNWFNSPSITNMNGLASPAQGWSGSSLPTSGSCLGGNGSGAWKEAQYCLTNLAGQPNVIFRFTFCSGTTCNNYDGLAIDLFTIDEFPEPVVDFTYQCLNDSTVRFDAAAVECPTAASWNFGDPASPVNTSTNISETHVFSGPGTYTVTWSVTEPCIGTFVKTRTVNILEVGSTVYPPSCPGAADGAIQLQLPALSGIIISWNVPGGFSGDSLSQLNAGNYQVIVNADSACAVVETITLADDPAGKPDPVLPSVLFICPPEIITVNPGVFDQYLWSTGSTMQQLDIPESGSYTVTVTDINGCTGTDSVRVIENCFTDMYFPSAFTPNSDSKNELFMPVAGAVEEFSLQIFNRFGQEIFNTTDQFKGWDGTYQTMPAPEGVYVWLVNYLAPDFKHKTERGVFELIR